MSRVGRYVQDTYDQHAVHASKTEEARVRINEMRPCHERVYNPSEIHQGVHASINIVPADVHAISAEPRDQHTIEDRTHPSLVIKHRRLFQ